MLRKFERRWMSKRIGILVPVQDGDGRWWIYIVLGGYLTRHAVTWYVGNEVEEELRKFETFSWKIRPVLSRLQS